MTAAMISGHLDLTPEEFDEHYRPLIDKAVQDGCDFVVGDARGADHMAQKYLFFKAQIHNTTVYHAYENPRHCIGYSTVSGFTSQSAKDKAMTLASDFDIAWVRPGREDSGTARNIERRRKLAK